MYRCFSAAPLAAALLALALPASAQVQRNFPQNALRGVVVMGNPPEITLNGESSRLAPGARIRGQDNMLKMSAALAGSRLVVNYTLDIEGLVKDVWILRPEEAAVRPWPRTAAQAQAWTFDPAAQTWTLP